MAAKLLALADPTQILEAHASERTGFSFVFNSVRD